MNPTSPLPCIDIGANLAHKSFDKDLEQVLNASREVGVSKIVLTGSSVAGSEKSARMCEKHPGFLYSTAGIHPHDASQYDESAKATLKTLLAKKQVVAVGECGLDYNRNFSPREDQVHCFSAHLELAAETGMPMFLHERDAFDEFFEMMKDKRDSIGKAVVHCFTSRMENAKAYLDLDLHLGITGWICDERRGKHLRDVVKEIPVERLMIETDAPYLAPRDVRPKIQRNEPRYLPHILQVIAECRGESVDKLGLEIIDTTEKFFGIQ